MLSYPKVNILLPTYNGEKYLSQQLDSLLLQTYPNISITIRDDGSSDRTLSIISEYQSAYPDRIIIIDNPTMTNLGYMQNFWTLLKSSNDSQYYAFCDQDDVWNSNKIELAVKSMLSNDDTLPLLYCSSFDYYDENLTFSGHAPLYPHSINIKDVLFYTPAIGFTIMINRSLRVLALKASSLEGIPHDSWCQKLATAFGKFIYDPTVTAKYRRHSSTVTYASSNKLHMIKMWIRNDILGDGLSENYFIIRRLYEEYPNHLTKDTFMLLKKFSSRTVSVSHYLYKLFYPKRLRPSLGGELALRLCFLLNK